MGTFVNLEDVSLMINVKLIRSVLLVLVVKMVNVLIYALVLIVVLHKNVRKEYVLHSIYVENFVQKIRYAETDNVLIPVFLLLVLLERRVEQENVLILVH